MAPRSLWPTESAMPLRETGYDEKLTGTIEDDETFLWVE